MNLTFAFDSLLIQVASGANVFSYFAQSNLAGKVVIFILVLFSIVAWTVMLGKFLDLSKLRSQNLRYERLLSKEAFHRYGSNLSDTDPHRATLRMGHVENALQRSVAEQIIRYESKMVVLGSIVTGAPFLGLLGTVWGVMDAFGGMTGAGSASLQSLAPGVSGALLTTVAGLVVAIPSVFGYNYLLQNTKIAVVELENFASTAADRIELEAQAAAQG